MDYVFLCCCLSILNYKGEINMNFFDSEWIKNYSLSIGEAKEMIRKNSKHSAQFCRVINNIPESYFGDFFGEDNGLCRKYKTEEEEWFEDDARQRARDMRSI